MGIIILFLLCSASFALPQDLPVKPDVMPTFHVSQRGDRSLDEGWQYMQTIVDADPDFPNLFNAYPVQIAFTHEGRGFIALLHTVFRTFDGGHTWINLDPSPPPNSSTFSGLRFPVYITGLVPRQLQRTSLQLDSLFLSTQNTANNSGRVRLISVLGGTYYLQPDTFSFLNSPRWLTGLAIPDSEHIFAFAGLDRLIYYRDSLSAPVFAAWDSLYATVSDHSVAGPVASVNDLMMAVGSEHWISRNRGVTWETAPAADAESDYGVSFADELHGLTGGGRNNPEGIGWAHYTTDGGISWSARTLATEYAIRCVEMVTPEIGFAAGGDYTVPHGEIWKTTDGGQTWSLDATMDAEITAIESYRSSGAYVTVVAAGVYPDFRGGVWLNRMYLPVAEGPVVVAEPDTLDLGIVALGDSASLPVTLQNLGTDTAHFTGTTSFNIRFSVNDELSGVTLAPQQSLVINVEFQPLNSDTSGAYSGTLTVNSADGRTELAVTGHVPLATRDRITPLPDAVALHVWPNPGNANFQIRFELAHQSNATLSIFDLTGRTVATLIRGTQDAGEHVVSWNASGAASGIYFVRLDAAEQHVMQKLLLIK